MKNNKNDSSYDQQRRKMERERSTLPLTLTPYVSVLAPPSPMPRPLKDHLLLVSAVRTLLSLLSIHRMMFYCKSADILLSMLESSTFKASATSSLPLEAAPQQSRTLSVDTSPPVRPPANTASPTEKVI